MRLSPDDVARDRDLAPPPRSSIWGVELVVAVAGVAVGLAGVLFVLG